MNIESCFPHVDDLERRAKRRIPHFVWEYLATGTGRDVAMNRNASALAEVQLEPGVMRGDLAPDLKTEFLGKTYDAPFGVAPLGASGMIWPGAEPILAAAAKRHNIPYALSMVATQTPEAVGPHCNGNDGQKVGQNVGMFQLYSMGNLENQAHLLGRAQDAGFETLVLTLDVPEQGRRERMRRAGFTMPPRLLPKMVAQICTCPAWALAIAKYGKPEFRTMDAYFGHLPKDRRTEAFAKGIRPSLTWPLLDELRKHWKGNLILKGICNVADAVQAKEQGADAVWVSNHGGRQLDTAPPTIQVLPKIREAVGPDYPLAFDSGVRSGLDVIKALALGANMVFLGRAFHFGVGALGEKGGDHTIKIIRDDLVTGMQQLGINDPMELGQAWVQT